MARSRRGPAGCSSRSRSMQINATRPNAQSATCRKQPGARRCRRAAGGRCVTICSFFFPPAPSYFSSLFFSSFIISRPPAPYVRTVRTMRKSLGTSRARLANGSAQPILTRNFQAHRVYRRTPRRGHINIARGSCEGEFRRDGEDRPGQGRRNGVCTGNRDIRPLETTGTL